MNKRVCVVAYTNYLSDARVRREAETLASDLTCEVTVLALKEKSIEPKSYLKNGVMVRELNAEKYRGKSSLRYLLSYFRFTLLALAECTRLLFKRSVDVVHVHNMPNFLILSAVGPRIFGKKVVLDIHDTTIETYEAKFKRGSNRILFFALRCEEILCCALAHRVICVNEIQRRTLIGRGIPEAKMLVSMNVPDPRIFCAGNSRPTAPTATKRNCLRLVYFGTMARRLGVDLAILAVAKAANTIRDLEFHIIGGGDDLGEFIDLSKELGIEQIVRFYEKAFPLEDLVKLLEVMDLGLVPNRRNPATELMLPVKMLECVSLGIPVVAPRLKTIQHYFPDDSVFYFDPDEVDSMSAAIVEAFMGEPLRKQKAENARKSLMPYDWKVHKLGLLDLYKSLAGARERGELTYDATLAVTQKG